MAMTSRRDFFFGEKEGKRGRRGWVEEVLFFFEVGVENGGHGFGPLFRYYFLFRNCPIPFLDLEDPLPFEIPFWKVKRNSVFCTFI